MGCTCVSFLMIYLFFIHCFLTDYKLSEWMGQGILNKNSIYNNWYHSIHEAFIELIKMIKSHEYYGAKLRALLKIIDTYSRSIIIISALCCSFLLSDYKTSSGMAIQSFTGSNLFLINFIFICYYFAIVLLLFFLHFYISLLLPPLTTKYTHIVYHRT